jgi:hypothetical protein
MKAMRAFYRLAFMSGRDSREERLAFAFLFPSRCLQYTCEGDTCFNSSSNVHNRCNRVD